MQDTPAASYARADQATCPKTQHPSETRKGLDRALRPRPCQAVAGSGPVQTQATNPRYRKPPMHLQVGTSATGRECCGGSPASQGREVSGEAFTEAH